MKKNYVLDTNVLIHDPKSIFQFEDNNLYIPIYVLEELDKLKGEQSLRGRNSREACRLLDELRCQGPLSTGVNVGDFGKLTIYVPKERKVLSVALDTKSMDSAILQCALEIHGSDKDTNTILVTMDVNLRVRAEALGMQTASYESQSVDASKIFTGSATLAVDDGDITNLYTQGYLTSPRTEDLYPNVCVTLEEPSGKTALGRYHTNEVKPLSLPKDGVMGIKPRNKEQSFALDMLLDDNIKLVFLSGSAGTGKTLLASSVGLHKILEGTYTRLLISRPIIPMGRDLGALPGTIKEKLDPWMQPIYDNLELLMMTSGKKKTNLKYDDLFRQDLVRIEPLTYIRGRSIPSQFILLDEAQNLSTHEIKTIITRCGEGSKIVLTGDPDQIDSPYLDKGSCGFSVGIDRMRNNPIVGHLTLTKGERSELANLAAQMM